MRAFVEEQVKKGVFLDGGCNHLGSVLDGSEHYTELRLMAEIKRRL